MESQKSVLHVGCGPCTIKDIPFINDPDNWKEVRLDADESVGPDVVCSSTDMWPIGDNRFNMVYSSHSLEHLYPYEVPVALAEMRRVLVGGAGVLVLVVPNVLAACKKVVLNGLNAAAYQLPCGTVITLFDILYGWREATAEGNHFMAHKCGFTADTLQHELDCAGFKDVKITSNESEGGYDLVAIASK